MNKYHLAMKKTEESPNQETEVLQPVVFYCKECKEIVQADRKGKSLTFTCPQCGKNNIAIGTQRSIENYYNIKN